jgi:uncharacterized membrane protein YdjX (TVP38/TMEM64 family)
MAGRLGVGAALLALLAVMIANAETIAAWLQWMDGLGPAGDLLFGLFYLAGTVLMVPASILEAGAGFLYGPLWGVLVAVLLGTASSVVAFLLGRTLLRGQVEHRIAGDARFLAIDRAIRADGLRLVILLRMSPLVPFNLFSLLLGGTPVSLRDYVLGTMVGHAFPVMVFVTTGSSVASALDLVGGAAAPAWVSWVGLGLTVVATVGVSRFAKRALDGALAAAR